MTLLKWQPSYSVGNPQIDSQHRHLFELHGRIHAGMRAGNGHEAAVRAVREMVAYAARHFADEEQLMQDVGYPDLDMHSEVHRRMAAHVTKLVEQCDQGEIKVMSLYNFLGRWLREHILETDMKYAPYVKGKNVA